MPYSPKQRIKNKISMNIQRVFCSIILLLGLLTSCQTTHHKSMVNASGIAIKDDVLEPFPPDTIDGVLVKVGTESILLSDLSQASLFYPNLSNQDVLNALIDEKIIEIKARDLGINLTEDELSKNIQEFLDSRNLTQAILIEELEKNGKTFDEYRNEFKREVIKQQLVGRVISPYVNVTKDEVNRFYLQQTKNVKQIEKVKLRSLLIEIPDNYNGDVLKYETVQKVRAQVENKADFVGLVREYSRAQDASSTLGILPPKTLSELPEEVRQKLADLQINQVIGPILLGQSVFFFQYLGADFASDSDLNTHYDEWKTKLMNAKFSENLSDYLRKERSAIKIVTRPLDQLS